ncbi:MAG: flagellin [Roseburia sp.]
MVIQHNISAQNTQGRFGQINGSMTKNAEKLSSGYRINRSADDAAGLAISEKMRSQIRGLARASKNAQDGISFVQTADGALQEVHQMLQRANELAIQAANGTNGREDREAIEKEFVQIKKEIGRISDTARFNNMRIFQPDNAADAQASLYKKEYHYKVIYQFSSGKMKVYADEKSDTDIDVSTLYARDPGLVGSIGLVNTSNQVANKVANELVPNAVSQILNAFPAFKNAQGTDQIELGLRIYSTPGSNTLAYAQASYSATLGEKPINLVFAVNTARFPDASSIETGKLAGELKATIMHELMHTVMQYNLPDGMSPRRQQYPMWFIEGTSQVAGGGFTANWNEWIRNPFIGMQYDVWDGEDIVRKWGLDDPTMGEYAQGYIATLYLGHLAAGSPGTVNAASIASGLNRIFEELLSGKSFDQALRAATGLGQAQIEGLFGRNATASAAEIRKLGKFVDDLGTAVGSDGAGSIVADGGLGAKPIDVVNSANLTTAPFFVGKINLGNGVIDVYDPDQNTPPIGWTNPNPPTTPTNPPTTPTNPPITPTNPTNPIAPVQGANATLIRGNQIRLQIGAETGSPIFLKRHSIGTRALGLESATFVTEERASQAIAYIGDAINKVSEIRSELGAVHNRLEYTIANLDNTVENTMAAESRIRDTDMAKEIVSYTTNKILLQVAQSMLAQVNMAPERVLQLLQ